MITAVQRRAEARHPFRSGLGFTLIEILIVVVILGILAAIVIPQFSDASKDAGYASVRTQLQTVRGQIEVFRQKLLRDPDMIGLQWQDLIENDYLTVGAMNPVNGQLGIAAAPAAGIGWIWRDSGTGSFQIYATNVDATAEFVE